MIGQVIGGRYKIDKQLARGGFSHTFLAFDIQKPENPKCVIKHFKPIATDDYVLEQAKRLFDQEANILQTLGTHDQIPEFFNHFEENQEFYLVLDYIQGRDICEELPPVSDLLSELETINLLQEILEVLAYVHHKNVIHRDIKPSNIRRRQDGKIVLIDFGAVKHITTSFINAQGETVYTIPIGTPGYMPSEQASGKPQFNSDIYAVGIIAIQALTGMIPSRYGNRFPTDSLTGEIIWRDRTQISNELGDVIDMMVRYDFRQRYQTAESALEAIKKISLVDTNSKEIPIKSIAYTTKQKAPIKKPKQRINLLLGIGVAIAATLSWLISLIISLKTENFLAYNNNNYKFQIEYPENWRRQDIGDAVTGQVVTFLSPKQKSSDNFQEKVTIRVEASVGTLEESMNDFVARALSSQADILYKNDADTLANKRGNKLIFTRKDDAGSFKYLQVWTLKDDKLYVITYTAEIAQYETFVNIAEKMIASFEIN
ncbi:hypothetical protein NIES2101_14255 [Calothrix sp. HK-06]|nr:hypothetical protein NIES2101_14255 [Calothrix sp. HK-06]